MNTFILSFLITSVTLIIISTLELWKAKMAAGKDSPPRFVDCGLGVRSGKKVYFKGLWIRPAFITPAYYNGDFQFLLANSSIQPIIFHAVRGDNRDGEGWLIYQVEYATTLEMLKEANRIIESSKQQKQ
jgi:hypothetical protein